MAKKNENPSPGVGSLPHAVEAEQSVLGSLLCDKCCDEIFSILQSNDFYREPHKNIFEVCEELYDQGRPIDTVLALDLLKQKGQLDFCGGASYLAGLTDSFVSPDIVQAHVGLIKEKSQKRKLATQALEVYESCRRDEELKNIFSIFDGVVLEDRTTFVPVGDLVDDSFKEIVSAHERKANLLGLSSGYRQLDSLLGGLVRGNFLTIGARPGVGKTAFALNLAVNIARQGRGVAFFSLEMTVQELMVRFLAMLGRAEGAKIRTGRLDEQGFERVAEACGVLKNLPILIDETPALSCVQLRARLRQMQRKFHPQAVIIDYLQLMMAPRAENRNQEVTILVAYIKQLAKEMQVPIVVLSQLSRRLEERADKRPILSDLRESGSIEQTSDVVMFLYGEERGTARELFVAKHRNGRTGEIKFEFEKEFTAFREVA